MKRFINKTSDPSKVHLNVGSKRSGGGKKPWFHKCHTGNEMIFGLKVVFTNHGFERTKEEVTEQELRSGKRFFGRVERTAEM